MIYMVTFTFTINIPQMLAYIPAPRIRHGLCINVVGGQLWRPSLWPKLGMIGWDFNGFQLPSCVPTVVPSRNCHMSQLRSDRARSAAVPSLLLDHWRCGAEFHGSFAAMGKRMAKKWAGKYIRTLWHSVNEGLSNGVSYHIWICS
jgi:hypothetical protein